MASTTRSSPQTGPASGQARAPFDTATNGSTIVLVHGAFSDASGWMHVIPRLTTAGYAVVAVQNDLLSLKDDVTNTRAIIDQLSGPVIVVGHSYGGAIISGAATGAKNVRALVYIAAYAPDEGEQIGVLNGKYPATAGAMYFRPDSRGRVYIEPAHFHEAFAGDVDPQEASIMAITQRPINASIFTETAGPAAWRDVRTWYLVSENDRTIDPELEHFFAERMKATTISLPSSHASLVSHPGKVAEFIRLAVKAVS